MAADYTTVFTTLCKGGQAVLISRDYRDGAVGNADSAPGAGFVVDFQIWHINSLMVNGLCASHIYTTAGFGNATILIKDEL
jgi:hypothetical protein